MPRRRKNLTAAESARRDRHKADFLNRKLGIGHPYAVLPVWVPYGIACILAPVINWIAQ